MTLMDGKALSEKIKSQLTDECKNLKENGVVPGLAVI